LQKTLLKKNKMEIFDDQTFKITEPKRLVNRHNIIISVEFDLQFWALVPAFNLNFHGGFTFEFEWLCIGIYTKLI
jgi:hypothetical protein